MVKRVLIRLCFARTVRIAGLVLIGLLTTSTPGSAQFGGAGVVEQPEQTPRSVPSFPKLNATEAKIFQQLSEPTSAEWTNKKLEEIMNDLEDRHGIEIWLDKDAISNQGIDLAEPITLKMDHISLRSCLKLILKPLWLVYVIEDDVMKITSDAKHAETVVTRVYPIGDLCETPADAEELLQTMECGLGVSRQSSEGMRYAISSKMKTLTVRDSFANQEKLQELILALRDAQAANKPAPQRVKPGGGTPKQI
jgi:hypothetical protein